MEFPQDLVRGSIEPVVLKLLNEQPRYGYEIVKLVNARTNGALQWKEGTLYPALHRMEGAGLVKAEWRDAPQDEAPGRKRKYYVLTRKGVKEFTRRCAEFQEFTSAVNLLLNGGGQ
jgi:DNA-binding PadR family transcriptional regulator